MVVVLVSVVVAAFVVVAAVVSVVIVATAVVAVVVVATCARRESAFVGHYHISHLQFHTQVLNATNALSHPLSLFLSRSLSTFLSRTRTHMTATAFSATHAMPITILDNVHVSV